MDKARKEKDGNKDEKEIVLCTIFSVRHCRGVCSVSERRVHRGVEFLGQSGHQYRISDSDRDSLCRIFHQFRRLGRAADELDAVRIRLQEEYREAGEKNLWANYKDNAELLRTKTCRMRLTDTVCG